MGNCVSRKKAEVPKAISVASTQHFTQDEAELKLYRTIFGQREPESKH